ncbi:hypothetical protein EDB89DRAFT_547015 [Lactarius sanguifluus]|nr:hypothetical protein EDB89DRAFT_547015 [Lactarius sanguifluus]
MVGIILRPIRHIYTILHQDTDSAPTRFSLSTDNWDRILFEPSSYPLCNLAGHIHDDSAPTSLACAAMIAPASLAGPPVPPHVVECLTGVPLLNSSHRALQTLIENLCVPATSQDLVTVIKGGADTSTTTVPLSTPRPSASTPPPSLPSPFQVLDDTPPTEHHSLPLAPTPGPPQPPLSSAPYPGAVVEGEGIAEAEERGALGPTSAVREIWLPQIFQHSRRHCP